MRIAIVAPSGVPFSVGGAEKLWWGLQNHINRHSTHQCELIKVPTRENSFWDLIDSYRRFYDLELSHFDAIISGKYPAFMVRHPNHHIYMLHCLRGLYDTYGLAGLPDDIKTLPQKALRIAELIECDQVEISSLFEALYRLRADTTIPQSTYAFPGPFIRKIIQFFDKKAMLRVRSFSAISQTVANRKEYFPFGAEVKVVYPPSNLPSFQTGSYEYFFTASRLDNAKRIDLIIKAYSHSTTDIPLKVAGVGPLEQRLKRLAGHDRRIQFLGFVSDEALIDYYANACAVLFVPFAEDYGYVAIEAMKSEKPVITTLDSGGPNEFVVNGLNGFSVKPSAEALSQKIDHLGQHPETCRKMGQNAKKSVEKIEWKYAAPLILKRALDNLSSFEERNRKRKRLTVVTTYPVYPPRGGGQNRIYHQYRHLARWYDVELVTLASGEEKPMDEAVAPGLREIRTPKSKQHAHSEWERFEDKLNVPVTDVAFPILYKLSPAFLSALKKSTEHADFVVASHPYSFKAIRDVYSGPIWYEALDVEYDLKKGFFPRNKSAEELLQQTRENESACCSLSELILACSKEVGDRLVELYHANPDKIVVVPNGVDLESVKFSSIEEKKTLKESMKYDRRFFALFMGSWHVPNIEAMEFLIGLAKELPDITFLMIGSGCHCFYDTQVPKNVLLLGIVDDEVKSIIHDMADVALNPMNSGSGTNLKVLEYMAAGVPVLSTEFGVRGLSVKNGEHVHIAELSQFGQAIRNIRRESALPL